MAIPEEHKSATAGKQSTMSDKLDSLINVAGGVAESTEHESGHTGNMMLAVRQDIATALALDGEYIPLSVTEDGRLRISGSVSTGLPSEHIEDSGHIHGDSGQLVFAVRKDTAAALADADGDYIPFTVDEDGKLYIKIEDTVTVAVGSALPAGTNNIGDVDVDSLPGSVEADLVAIKAAVEILDNIVSGSEAQVDVVTQDGVAAEASALNNGMLIQGDDGTNRKNIAVNASTGNVQVDLGTALPSGTNNIGDVDVASLPGTVASDLTAIKTAVQVLDNVVSGSEAQVDVVTQDGVAAENTSLGNGILIQGDDGTDRKNIAVDATSGNVQVDIATALPAGTANIGDVDIASLPGTVASDITAIKDAVEILDNVVSGNEAQVDVVSLDGVDAEDASLGNGILIQGDDGTDRKNIAVDATSGNVQIDVATALPSGSNNIGNVDVASLDGVDAEDAALGNGILLQGDDGTNRKNVAVDPTTGNLQVDVGELPSGSNNIGDVDVVSLPGTVATDLTAIKNAVEVLDNIVSGSEAQVDVVTQDGVAAEASSLGNGMLLQGDDGTDRKNVAVDATSGRLQVDIPDGVTIDPVTIDTALPAGDNNIGNVDIASAIPAGDNNIGNVDVVTLPSLPAGSNNIGDVDVASLPTEFHQEDYDTDAGTDNTFGVGIVVPSTTGAVAVPGDVTNGLDVDVTRVQGTVSVDATAAGDVPVTLDGETVQLAAGSNNIGDVDIASALPAGNNNIGNVDVVTLPSLPAGDNNIGNVDLASSLPAGDHNIGNVDLASAIPAGSNNIGDVGIATLPAEIHQEDFDTSSSTDDTHAMGVAVPSATGAVVITGSAANGLDVDVTRVQGTVLVDATAAGDVPITLAGEQVILGAADNNIGNVDLASSIPAGTNNIGDVDVLTLPELPAGTNNIGDVDVLTLPSLPAGSANIGDVDIASLPGTIAADITAIKDAVEVLDNMVSGSEAQVDVVTQDGVAAESSSLNNGILIQGDDGTDRKNIAVDPTTGNVQVDLSAELPAGSNNIGDVDVVSLPGTLATDITAIKTAVEKIDNVVSGSEAQVDVVTQDGVAAEASALGNGILLQGDDGTDRKNIAVDPTSGNIQVDLGTSIPAGSNNIGDVDIATLPGSVQTDISAIKTAVEKLDDVVSGSEAQVDIVSQPGVAAEDSSLGSGMLIQGDDGTDRKNILVDATTGAVKVDLNSSLPPGDNNIGNVDIVTQDGVAAEDSSLGNGMLLQGDDGTDRKNIAVDASTGAVKVDVNTALPAGNNNIGNVDLASSIPAGSNNIGDVDVASLPSLPAGDNNIGNVDIVTLPGVYAEYGTPGSGMLIQGDDGGSMGGNTRNIAINSSGRLQVDLASSLPSGSNNIGDVDIASYAGGSVPMDIDEVGVGTTTTAALVEIINENSSGDNTIVTVSSGEVVKVLAFHMVAQGDVITYWKSASAGAISGPLDLTTNSGLSVDASGLPVCKTTTAGENLVLNLDAAVIVGGTVTYVVYTP